MSQHACTPNCRWERRLCSIRHCTALAYGCTATGTLPVCIVHERRILSHSMAQRQEEDDFRLALRLQAEEDTGSRPGLVAYDLRLYQLEQAATVTPVSRPATEEWKAVPVTPVSTTPKRTRSTSSSSAAPSSPLEAAVSMPPPATPPRAKRRLVLARDEPVSVTSIPALPVVPSFTAQRLGRVTRSSSSSAAPAGPAAEPSVPVPTSSFYGSLLAELEAEIADVLRQYPPATEESRRMAREHQEQIRKDFQASVDAIERSRQAIRDLDQFLEAELKNQALLRAEDAAREERQRRVQSFIDQADREMARLERQVEIETMRLMHQSEEIDSDGFDVSRITDTRYLYDYFDSLRFRSLARMQPVQDLNTKLLRYREACHALRAYVLDGDRSTLVYCLSRRRAFLSPAILDAILKVVDTPSASLTAPTRPLGVRFAAPTGTSAPATPSVMSITSATDPMDTNASDSDADADAEPAQ